MLLSNEDIVRIEQLGYAKDFFVREEDGWLQLKNDKGRCVFHDKTHCTIYDYRPKGCSLYPIVFNKFEQKAIYDKDCPYPFSFMMSDATLKELFILVEQMEYERLQRNS
jgi:Fe-S-cluster containining protein